MPASTQVIFWKRIDFDGLERLVLTRTPDAVVAESTVVCVEDGGFRLNHAWKLTPDWRVIELDVERWGAGRHEQLSLRRHGDGWRVNGAPRPDLAGAAEPDLSVTPFCNTFPIRRLLAGDAPSLTLDTCYIDAAKMTVVRSSQRYDRQAADRFRYVDLGVSLGFEADLAVDGEGLILAYEHLFQRVAAA